MHYLYLMKKDTIANCFIPRISEIMPKIVVVTTAGPQGSAGVQGAQGIAGVQGPQGPSGASSGSIPVVAFRAERSIFDQPVDVAAAPFAFTDKLYDNQNGTPANNFQNSTTFVAPITGVYHFDFQATFSPEDTVQVTADLIVQTSLGDLIDASYATEQIPADTIHTVSVSADLFVQAGQQVQLLVGAQNLVIPLSAVFVNDAAFNGHLTPHVPVVAVSTSQPTATAQQKQQRAQVLRNRFLERSKHISLVRK